MFAIVILAKQLTAAWTSFEEHWLFKVTEYLTLELSNALSVVLSSHQISEVTISVIMSNVLFARVIMNLECLWI